MPETKPLERPKAGDTLISNCFRNNIYEIPIYQRPLSWTEEQFQLLVEDILDAMVSGEDNYFLGSIILKRIRHLHYEIVDGQQRLVSLLILFAVARDYLSKFASSQREKDTLSRILTALENYIIEPGDPLANIPEKPRIKPWRDVENIFEKYIYTKNLRKLIEDIETGKVKYPDKNSPVYHLYEAVRTFYEFFEELSGVKRIIEFLQYLLSRVYLVYITTDTRASAFRLFNVLNTRGLPLTPADVLKSINLEAIQDERTREEYATKWRSLEEDLGREELDNVISFVRTILAKEKAKKEMFEEYKKLFDRGILQKGTSFFDTINTYAEIYRTKVLDPNLNISNPLLQNRYKILIDIMKRYLPFSDWIPPLLHFYYKFEEDSALPDFLTVLERKVFIEWCADFTASERITSSVNVIRLIENSGDPREVIRLLPTYKEEVKRGRESRAIDFTNRELIEKVLTGKLEDRQFYSLKGGKLARYVLLRIDMEMWDENFPGYSNIRTISVEHILPRKPRGVWMKSFTEEQIREMVDILGNLTLLSRRKNSKAANYDFKRKKESYFNITSTPFRVTQMLQEYDEWTPETLVDRHYKLLKLVKRIYLLTISLSH